MDAIFIIHGILSFPPFLISELLLNWLEEPHMEEIENAGEMAGVEDGTTVEDETEIGNANIDINQIIRLKDFVNI